MSSSSVSVPVEYVISTTSDWTKFQIVEGGWWSDVKIECLTGCERIRLKRVIDDKAIALDKARNDTALVEVKVTGTLHIDKKYLHSEISHSITKGNLNQTTVRTIVQGKEISSKTNRVNIPNDPDNRHDFAVPTSMFTPAALKQMTEGEFGDLDNQARKCRKYERIVDFLNAYSIIVILLPPLLLAIHASLIGRAPPLPIEEVLFWMGVGIALWFIPTRVFDSRAKKYRLDDDQWATYYTHLILDNLGKFFNAKTTGLKEDYRKKTVNNAKEFISCIEEKWKVGRFKLAQDSFGEPISELKKNIRQRVIPSLKGDDATLKKVEQIMREFLVESGNLGLKGINKINQQMSSSLEEKQIVGLRGRLRARVREFFNTYKPVKHVLFVASDLIGCSALYYVAVTYLGVSKNYAYGGSIAVFSLLMTIYLRQPKE